MFPVVFLHNARFPIAVLLDPDVFKVKTRNPIAVLLDPDVLERKAAYPIAVLRIPVVLTHKAKFPAAKLFVPVAEELKFVDAPIEMFEETFPPPKLINKPLMVPFEPLVEIEPVTPNDPVISADPVKGKGEPPVPEVVVPSANRYWEPAPGLKNPEVAVTDPVTVKEPEMFTVFKAKSPPINGVPEPDAIYNLLLSSVDVEGPAANPIAILFEELPEKFNPAFWPKAILLDPTDEEIKALFPIAVLWRPIVLLFKAYFPIAVLLHPVVLERKASCPIAVLLHPVVL